MLKNILNLAGAQKLTKNEQKTVKGGIPLGCQYTTWSGTSLTNCKATRPGGGSYSYSNGICKAFFCTPVNVEL